jgi:hypothetical protein
VTLDPCNASNDSHKFVTMVSSLQHNCVWHCLLPDVYLIYTTFWGLNLLLYSGDWLSLY